MKRQGGLGFFPRRVVEEERFYRTLNLKGRCVYDVGSYEGILSLYFAKEVGPDGYLVVCEPNPVSYCRTVRNLEINALLTRTSTCNIALGDKQATLLLTYPTAEPALSTFDPIAAARFYKDYGTRVSTCTIAVETLDNLINDRKLPRPDLIKIDTEGWEQSVLRGALHILRMDRPALFIELHGGPLGWLANKTAVFHLLTSLGYSIRDMYGTKVNSPTDPVSHYYASFSDHDLLAPKAQDSN
jgi:FkbM family methyltransferase